MRGNDRSMIRFIQITLIFFAYNIMAYSQEHQDLGRLTDFPMDKLVWLGSVIGEVAIDPEIPIVVEKFGRIHWLVVDSSAVKEDEVICQTDAEKIQLSERELELKKRTHPNALFDLESSYQEKKKTQRNSIAELMKTLSELKMTATERALLGVDFEKRLEKDRIEIEKQLESQRAKLNGDYYARGYEDEKAKLELEIDKAENNHKELLRSSEYRALSSGILKILTHEVIKPETNVAMIVKKGSAEAMVEISDSRLTKIPPAELVIRISGDEGNTYLGNYVKTLENKAYQQSAPIYVFEILKKSDQQAVPSTLRGKRIIEVCRRLDQLSHVIPKADLLFRFPNEINESGWPAFIQKRWGNVQIHYIGPRELMISNQNEN